MKGKQKHAWKHGSILPNIYGKWWTMKGNCMREIYQVVNQTNGWKLIIVILGLYCSKSNRNLLFLCKAKTNGFPASVFGVNLKFLRNFYMEDMLALVILSAVGLHQTTARPSRHLGPHGFGYALDHGSTPISRMQSWQMKVYWDWALLKM